MANAGVTDRPEMAVMHCVQAVVIDMRSNPSPAPNGTFNWILHCRDRASKFTWLFPLHSLESHEVASHLRSLFFRFGPPHVLKTSNGEEFLRRPMKQLLEQFRCTKHVTSRSPNLKVHGLIARTNLTLERRLSVWIAENEGVGWAEGLERLEHESNCSWTRTIKGTPFQRMFARESHDFKLASIQNRINEDGDKSVMRPAVRGNTSVWLPPPVADSHSCHASGVTAKVAGNNGLRVKGKRLHRQQKGNAIGCRRRVDGNGEFDDSVSPGYRHFMSSVRGPQKVHCLCMGECGNGRCACYKYGLKCSSRCHRDHSHVCRNIETRV